MKIQVNSQHALCRLKVDSLQNEVHRRLLSLTPTTKETKKKINNTGPLKQDSLFVSKPCYDKYLTLFGNLYGLLKLSVL